MRPLSSGLSTREFSPIYLNSPYYVALDGVMSEETYRSCKNASVIGETMDASRRIWLIWLAVCSFMPSALIQTAFAQEDSQGVIEVRIENRTVVEPAEAIRISEGDTIELRWTSDEAVEIHLHGYDMKIDVRPNEPAAMVIEAYATGRFPLTSHGWGEGGHGHDALTYLEVYPR